MITTAYAMFGVVDGVREPESETYRVEWPETEVHDDIFAVAIYAHGDNTSTIYLKVFGSNPDSVKDKWKQVRDHWPRLQAVVWP